MDLVTPLTAVILATSMAGGASHASRITVTSSVVTAADSASAGPSAVNANADQALAQWQPFVAEASTRFRVPEPWVRAVMAAESGGRTTLNGQPIISPMGAMGLMQVMPGTYQDMRLRLGLGADPFDPHDNILAGTAFLRTLYERYGYPGVFAAYNAGPARFDDYLVHGVSLPEETLHYLAAIAPGLHDAVAALRPDAAAQPLPGKPPATSPSGNGLFFVLGTRPIAATPPVDSVPGEHAIEPDFAPDSSSSGSLFVPLSGASHPAQDKPR